MYLFVEYGKRFNFRDLNETVLMHQDIGFGPQYINYERQIEYSTLAKEAIRDTLSDEAISEEMRILYVALTRAKEKLIMVGTQKEVEKQMQIKQELLELIPIGENKLAHQIVGRYKTYIDWLELVYLKSKQEKQEVLELFCHQTKDVLQEKNEELKRNDKCEFKPSKELKKKIQEKLNWQYQNQNLTTIPSKSSVTAIKNLEKQETLSIKECELKVPLFLTYDDKLTGAKKGTIMHMFLQKLDLRKNYTENDLKELIDELEVKHFLSRQELQTISISKVQKFLTSDLAKDIKKAKIIYQEKPFYIYLTAGEIYGGEEKEKVVVQGIIDLYYRNSDGKLILVDYKTDFVENMDEKILIQKYKKQIEIYEKAIEYATGEKVEKSYIYSLYLNKAIDICEN